jgi:hypothetical protein
MECSFFSRRSLFLESGARTIPRSCSRCDCLWCHGRYTCRCLVFDFAAHLEAVVVQRFYNRGGVEFPLRLAPHLSESAPRP